MKYVTVKQIRKLIVEKPVIVHENETIKELILAITGEPRARVICVVNDDKKLVGLVTVHDLVKLILPKVPELLEVDILGPSVWRKLCAEYAHEIMMPPIYVKDDENIESVLNKLQEAGLDSLPVVDSELHIIGEINLLEILEVWLEKTVFKEIRESR